MKYRVLVFCFLLAHTVHAEQWIGSMDERPVKTYRITKPKSHTPWLLSFAAVSATSLIMAGTYRVKADWDLQNARALRDLSANMANNGMFFIDTSEYLTQARTLENRADRKKRLAKIYDVIGASFLVVTLIELRF